MHLHPGGVTAASRASLHQTTERILILGTTPLAERLVREIAHHGDRRGVVLGVLDDREPPPGSPLAPLFLGRLERLPEALEVLRPHRIVLALAERRGTLPAPALLDSYLSGAVDVDDGAQLHERLTGALALDSLTTMSVIGSGCFRPSRFHQAFARALSFAAALAALAALAPLLALIALAIKLDSPGPVLFTQRRAGAHGRPFTLLKFRTMLDGERRSEWEADNRDRVTRVGRWLRAFRLDELPQFVNVLRGDMNLVGPRPHPVSNLGLFTLVARNLNELTGAAVGCYSLRLLVRPGITGWAQVRYRYANNLEEEIEKLAYDLYYVKHMSPWLDLRILIETVGVVLRTRLPGRGRHTPETAGRAEPFGAFRNVSPTTEVR